MTDFFLAFSDAYPKAIDFAEKDYQTNKAEADQAAAEAGYRLAGMRLGRAVFTTKNISKEVLTDDR